jgi:23S rRNA (guanosine2251-2'-O)-methyltransferase
LWIGCADKGGQALFNANLKGPLALVIGSEGEGVSRLIKEKCDFVVSIPMYGKIDSLNASVASGILLYEVIRQRNFIK